MRHDHSSPRRRGRGPSFRLRVGVALLFAAATASASYAYTAANLVPETRAGQGSAPIGGYTASGIAYDLNNLEPENLDRLTFSILPPGANTVKVRLGTAWHTCSNAAGAVTCPGTGPFVGETVAGATNLVIVALQNTDI